MLSRLDALAFVCGLGRFALKLNRLTDYAVILLTRLSDQSEVGPVQLSAAAVANETGVPLPTVAKVLKALSQAGLVQSSRGVSGGYTLARDAADISVADIILAIEGPIALTACVDGSEDDCASQSFCAMAGNWDAVNKAVRMALENIRLPDMAPNYDWLTDDVAKAAPRVN